jgi:cell division protein FtsN
MAAKRKAAGRRRSKKRAPSGGIPAWFWLLGGILIGLGAAVALMFNGYLPELKQSKPTVDSNASAKSDSALLENKDSEDSKPKKPRYDFFTVLPEMEVVVPEQQLSREAEPVSGTTASNTGDKYILQVGSFRNAADAEQMKARLALLGSIASVQTVTVDSQTWHRVRIGPINGAREADEKRRMLADNKIDTLVMKVNP